MNAFKSWYLPVAGASIAAFVLAGCNATSDGVVTTSSHVSGGGGGGSQTAKLGQPIVIKGDSANEEIQVTPTKFLKDAKVDQFSKPGHGKIIDAVQFKIKDVGKAAYSDAPSNGAVLIDSKGQQYQSDIIESLKGGALLGGTVNIPSGGIALGYIAFEVPAKAKITSVQFGEDSGFGQTGQWNL